MTSSNRKTLSSSELRANLDLFEVKPGLQYSLAVLKTLLPDVTTVLFFGKVYELDHIQLSNLLHHVVQSDLTSALFGEGGAHSTDLQDYLVDICGQISNVNVGDLAFDPIAPTGEILPELWKSLEVEVAQSIKQVAAKLESVVGLMPGKQGNMVFQSMMKLNVKRPTLGVHRAVVHHEPLKENLLILDVSGSMNSSTISRIINDVVALSYQANAHMAVVSNTTTHWEPGSYNVDDVLRACEYGGTYYETLKPLFDRDWGVVITVADYDSSPSAKDRLYRCSGRIDQVLDISLVNRPTFLAECVGQLADEVRPLLIAQSTQVLSS